MFEYKEGHASENIICRLIGFKWLCEELKLIKIEVIEVCIIQVPSYIWHHWLWQIELQLGPCLGHGHTSMQTLVASNSHVYPCIGRLSTWIGAIKDAHTMHIWYSWIEASRACIWTSTRIQNRANKFYLESCFVFS